MFRRAAFVMCAALVFIAAACSSSSKPASLPTSEPVTSAQSRPGDTSAAATASGGLSVPQIVEKLAPSIVRVQTESATLDVFGRTQPSSGVGTGVIIDTDGHIVTNNHVVTLGTGDTPADHITVTLADQTSVDATIIGRDQPTDLAVLKIDAANLQPATFADADDQQVGEDVVAIGFALDLKGGPTVTRGVLSAKGRTIDEQPFQINDALQTDAGINPGNSGGPLVNTNGEVIGINTAIIPSAQAIGFSISSSVVTPTVQALISGGQIERGYLGVGTVSVTKAIARNFGLPVNTGVAISTVGNGTPAQKAGIRPNDVIVRIDDQQVNNNGDLLAILAKHRSGDIVTIEYYRGSDKRTANVTLAARPGG
ncbi:MAG: trypsin-like peptidase domain-containing protein [Chloroflexota bacterium]|nr:trypsin-like peptidase domain-containing protein [Chloroflexota bacterium]